MGLKLKIYELLVNRRKTIKYRYEAYVAQQGAAGRKNKLSSWLYLLRLNFCYYILHDRSAEVKKLPERLKLVSCESGLSFTVSPEEFAERLFRYDEVSFDIFDTLIYRRTAKPTDVFYFVGKDLAYPDFRRLRIEAERQARQEKYKSSKSYEVDIYEIADCLSQVTSLAPDIFIKAEIEAEKKLCFANPYMKRVWDILTEKGVKPVILSDMYLPSQMLEELLDSAGYSGWKELWVSCEKGRSKAAGTAYPALKEKFGENIAHIGDNAASDIENAIASGITAFRCENPNEVGAKFRTRDMSPITGSLWAGAVNNRFHSGLCKYNKYYELGYAYGGLLIYGYCAFIEKYAREISADKIFFLSRDGYIVKEIYDKYFGARETEYVHWSRSAASVISAEKFPWDFVQKYILQKVSDYVIMKDAVVQTGLASLAEEMPFDMDARFTEKQAEQLCGWIYKNREKVSACFEKSRSAAVSYIADKTGGARRILTVDCGWAASGHFSLAALVNEYIDADIKLYGAVAGANDAYHLYSDTADTFFADGTVRSYCFSSSHNRDLYEFHKPALGYNLYFEMLMGSTEGTATGFEIRDGKACAVLNENSCADYVALIHDGIRDFASDYSAVGWDFVKYISGRDAYAPFKAAVSDKRYFSSYFSEYVYEEKVEKRS